MNLLSPASAKHLELECKPQDRSGNGRYFRVKKRPGKEVDAGKEVDGDKNLELVKFAGSRLALI